MQAHGRAAARWQDAAQLLAGALDAEPLAQQLLCVLRLISQLCIPHQQEVRPKAGLQLLATPPPPRRRYSSDSNAPCLSQQAGCPCHPCASPACRAGAEGQPRCQQRFLCCLHRLADLCTPASFSDGAAECLKAALLAGRPPAGCSGGPGGGTCRLRAAGLSAQ